VEKFKYLVIGGGLAGHRGCEGIRKVDAEGSVALVAAEPHPPYQRPPLSKGYLRGEDGLGKVYLEKDDEQALDGVQLFLGVRADGIDTVERSVTLDDGRVLGYEKLLLAPGGRAWRLPIAGNDLPNVFTLRTIENANAIRELAQEGKRALVVGGSFIGSEVAASLTQLGLDVTMVFVESRLLESLVPEELSDWLQKKYRSEGVRILPSTSLECLTGQDTVMRAVMADHESHVLAVDLVVMGVGIRLNTGLAKSVGFDMADDGGVLVDAQLRTSDPSIYAAGDIATWPDATFGRRLRVEHWDVARRQGYRAGRNMAGEEKPYTALPYYFSDLFDFSFEVWGVLTSWDRTVLRGSFESQSFACYYFDRGKLTGVLTAGRPEEERQPMQDLVRARPAYDEVAAELANEDIELASLLE
jgi:3-phenylpropionate/trans-cinnamate dioxygenase ferredoxin reductase component